MEREKYFIMNKITYQIIYQIMSSLMLHAESVKKVFKYKIFRFHNFYTTK